MFARKKNLNKEIIALFSDQSSIVTIPKLYIQLTNNHSLACVLNQCIYWSNKSDCKDGWFYKDYREWFKETCIPERTLRRRFERLEKLGLITTKVKMVKGKNKKHIHPHIDKIIDSLSTMLESDCPNRPHWHFDTKDEQNTCTKVTPTGHIDRLQNSISIYTEEYKKLTNYKTPVSSSSFSQTQNTPKNEQITEIEKPDYFGMQMDEAGIDVQLVDANTENVKSDYNNNQVEKSTYLSNIGQKCHLDSKLDYVFSQSIDENILSAKLSRDPRTDVEFLEVVRYHVDNNSDAKYPRLQRANAVVKLLRKLCTDNVLFNYQEISANDEPGSRAPETQASAFTPEELELASDYKHFKSLEGRGGLPIEKAIPDERKRNLAAEIISRINAMKAEEGCQPRTSARRFCLSSVSSLVSHHA